jgi:hypothetical protein
MGLTFCKLDRHKETGTIIPLIGFEISSNPVGAIQNTDILCQMNQTNFLLPYCKVPCTKVVMKLSVDLHCYVVCVSRCLLTYSMEQSPS